MNRLSILFRWIIYRQKKRRKEHEKFWKEKIEQVRRLKEERLNKGLAK